MSVAVSDVVMAPPAANVNPCMGGSPSVAPERKSKELPRSREESKEESLTLDASENQLIRDVLEQHGSPSNRNDQYKTLEQIMLDSERDICIFAGAIELLTKQLEESRAGWCCSVCARGFEAPEDFDTCLDQLEVKKAETEASREESNIVKIFHATRKALQQYHPSRATEVKKFESRVSFNMRSGALTELRNQKAECLQDQRCFACQRAFEGVDITQYLQRVDRNAFQMQERLHVHN